MCITKVKNTFCLGPARLTEKPKNRTEVSENRTEPKPIFRDGYKTEPNRKPMSLTAVNRSRKFYAKRVRKIGKLVLLKQYLINFMLKVYEIGEISTVTPDFVKIAKPILLQKSNRTEKHKSISLTVIKPNRNENRNSKTEINFL